MILLDTHVLIWWIDNSPRLPLRTKKIITDESKKGTILVSSISVWEISFLVSKGRITIPKDVALWIKDIEGLSFIQFVPVDNEIAQKSVYLPGNFHGDPADRFIVATAREYGATLVTSDRKIRRYQAVKSIW